YFFHAPATSELYTLSLHDALPIYWAGNDIPNVYANFVNLNPLTNHAWFAAGSTVTLWFNLNPGNGGATGIDEAAVRKAVSYGVRSEEHTSELQSPYDLVCRLLLEK